MSSSTAKQILNACSYQLYIVFITVALWCYCVLYVYGLPTLNAFTLVLTFQISEFVCIKCIWSLQILSISWNVDWMIGHKHLFLNAPTCRRVFELHFITLRGIDTVCLYIYFGGTAADCEDICEKWRHVVSSSLQRLVCGVRLGFRAMVHRYKRTGIMHLEEQVNILASCDVYTLDTQLFWVKDLKSQAIT